MKIGIDGRAAKWYRGTGIGTYTYQLISCLNNIDNINNYLLFMPKSFRNDICLKKNFALNTIPPQNKTSFWEEINIPNKIKHNKIELYHVPQNGVGLPVDKNCKFAITLHDVIPYKMPETVSDRYLKIFSDYIPEIIPKCDGIITVSNFSKNDIMKAFNFPENKIYVTHLASEDIYKPLDKNISKYIAKRYYSIDEDYILYVGGFSPRKNILGLIESFNKFISLYKKPIKLVIAGTKGKSYSTYRKRTEILNISDKVIFPGFISMDHLPYIYNAAKLFVYPSFYEGFGLPPIEAMACGIPVITSNTTSLPEVVGDGALLVNPKDQDDLCQAMLNILSDDNLKKKLTSLGIQRASQLNWKKTASDTITIYNKIIGKKINY
ncbi:glycosyltransferase family 4 protein [Clostridium sp. MT-14]|uniref:Glycosyltransferase family 4 protein n=1 Tax=Clostridium aromativorans TaxID=2836848 RepID=A0ABS8N3E2_9CLOT|nr:MULTISPECIES: glycosyltransferase family 1 protein [Clostridium]KAA8675913.1 glycosyltransferase family 4 protein [Clostridium sp. HV4-5-A1G]MCC9293699.1 glycosyltransferase family 4 protein [Clostridium aromativorans]CAB1254128.1 Glycosyltransferase family 1 protein [Clostridiaceae bacterium BL-3]